MAPVWRAVWERPEAAEPWIYDETVFIRFRVVGKRERDRGEWGSIKTLLNATTVNSSHPIHSISVLRLLRQHPIHSISVSI
jgi:hypothetical protein